MKNTLIKKILLLNVMIFALHFSNAQPGTLDPTFGTGGKVTLQVNGNISNAFSSAVQSNGKIIVAGGVNINGTTVRPSLARFNTDGTLDNAFGTNGQVIAPFFGNDTVVTLRTIAIQPDGKIVGGGSYGPGVLFSLPQHDIFLVRYNTDGTLDATFGNGGWITSNLSNGVFGDGILNLVFQPDGKILVCGVANQGNNPNYHYDFMVARFTTTGALDNTFGIAGVIIADLGGAFEFASTVLTQPDKKILVSGTYTTPFGDYDYVLLRLDSTGAFDNSFATNGRINAGFGTDPDDCGGMVLQPDGSIVLNGGAQQGLLNGLGMLRITSTGILDNTFGTGGKLFHQINGNLSFANRIIIQPDGKLISAGSVSNNGGNSYDFALTRVNSNGTIDNSFGINGDATIDFAAADDESYSLAFQSDLKILIVGNATTTSGVSYGIARVASGLNVGVTGITATENKFSIFPNPINQFAVISCLSEENKNRGLKIIDVTGREVLHSLAFNSYLSIDLSKLENGIYFVLLDTEDKIETQKLIVQH